MAAPTALATAWWRTWTISETPASALGHQEAAAADGDQRLLARVGLHPVHAFLDAGVHSRQRGLHEGARQVGHPPPVAEVDQAGGDGHVGGGERGAAEHAAVVHQPIADAARPHPAPVVVDQRAAAEADGQKVRHPEQRAHAADLDDVVGLAGEAVAQAADVGGGAADVDDDRVAQAREERRTPHAVGGPGREAVDRERSAVAASITVPSFWVR